ncbi:hypothetical protein CMI37_30885 [Candidatus Pacearchaeota archaeon]|nr:hypothetical protein [Candidatus Pacearchaeota archaeon]|tara:strand:- start:316 stop:858 length:543 start_codon:yes stop_codon:yes gene_type:complete
MINISEENWENNFGCEHTINIGVEISNKFKKIAENRHNLHRGQDSHRPLSFNYEYIGLIGEYAFGYWSGLAMDMEYREQGDFGIDFQVGNIGIDVKTAIKAYNLLLEKDKKHTTIIVLAQYNNDTSNEKVILLGWEYGNFMRYMPCKDFGYGVINHYLDQHYLRPMSLLEKVIEFKLGET